MSGPGGTTASTGSARSPRAWWPIEENDDSFQFVTTDHRSQGDLMNDHAVVSREEWVVARKVLLAKEKQLTRLRDDLSRERRELPWVKVETSYVFEGPDGKETLADLFAGRS